MNKRNLLFLILPVAMVLLLAAEPAIAGPGGKIANAIFDTFWGKVLMVILFIIFMPLIFYTVIKEWRAERRSRRDLKFMARLSPDFEWLKLRQRMLDCFYRIHDAWSREDVQVASEFMSDWYWQNQQLAFIDRWEREGLVNVCDVKKVTNIKPLLFLHRNDDDIEHNGSLVVASISAKMKDYLAERENGKVVEGSKRYKEVEAVWSFTMIDGKWRVTNIEEDHFSLEYAGMIKELPPIEETIGKEYMA